MMEFTVQAGAATPAEMPVTGMSSNLVTLVASLALLTLLAGFGLNWTLRRRTTR